MSTTISTETKAVTTVERTFCVERQTPRSGVKDYRLLVHREVVKTLADGTVLGVQPLPEAVNELVSKVMQRVCTRDYLGACQAAKVPADLMAAEVSWYDALVVEIRAEKAAGTYEQT
jgi:hypothetical protein